MFSHWPSCFLEAQPPYDIDSQYHSRAMFVNIFSQFLKFCEYVMILHA